MQVPSGISDSVAASGSTAATPASGAVIATLAAASLPAGKYLVQAEVHESGTPDANAVNAQLKAGATVLANLPTNASSTTPCAPLRVTLDGATALTLNVGAAAGGAAAVYNGTITATKIA